MNQDTDLRPFKKINSKWFIDLNVKCKNMKLLQDKIGENLDDIMLKPKHNYKTKQL